jgi:hypothetical protein
LQKLQDNSPISSVDKGNVNQHLNSLKKVE